MAAGGGRPETSIDDVISTTGDWPIVEDRVNGVHTTSGFDESLQGGEYLRAQNSHQTFRDVRNNNNNISTTDVYPGAFSYSTLSGNGNLATLSAGNDVITEDRSPDISEEFDNAIPELRSWYAKPEAEMDRLLRAATTSGQNGGGGGEEARTTVYGATAEIRPDLVEIRREQFSPVSDDEHGGGASRLVNNMSSTVSPSGERNRSVAGSTLKVSAVCKPIIATTRHYKVYTNSVLCVDDIK